MFIPLPMECGDDSNPLFRVRNNTQASNVQPPKLLALNHNYLVVCERPHQQPFTKIGSFCNAPNAHGTGSLDSG